MKKVLVLLMAVIAFSACEGPQGPPGEDGYLFIDSSDHTVPANRWEYRDDSDGSNPHYIYELSFSRLNWDIYENGIINVYLYANPDNLDDGYYPLGDVYPIEIFHEDGEEQWTEYYSCLIYPGGITFTARCSDFAAVEFEDWRPGKQTFRVVLSR